MTLSGKLTKKLVENHGAGRHGDGNGLYLVVDPSGARRWIVRVVVKGQKNKKGAPLRTDFGLGGANIVTLNQARERALDYRRMAKQGLNPRLSASREVPTFEEVAQLVHIERLPTWKNPKHGQQWINTLRDYAFPKIGRMPIDSIDQPEVLMCLRLSINGSAVRACPRTKRRAICSGVAVPIPSKASRMAANCSGMVWATGLFRSWR
jgi:hypothetical protein